MKNPEFSFIILTFNEESHLPRLLQSIHDLNARSYVLDSGSTDGTRLICEQNGIPIQHHPFENHPKQWDAALKIFDIQTPWLICLDADQSVSKDLFDKLTLFRDADYLQVDGIYFNRKNYFKGKWIRFGGYYPKYLLKMFRYGRGYSDLNETMDHRFQVPGQTLIWKNGYLIEENLKENEISFWINKHNRYSDQVAYGSLVRQQQAQTRYKRPRPWKSPNERNAWQKQVWAQLPPYIRPSLYFIYRMCFQLGILDGKQGIIFHFLQSFWFRLIVDIKIEELRKKQNPEMSSSNTKPFLCRFVPLFSLLYIFHLAYIGITTPGGIYFDFLNKNLNYITHWRIFHIQTAAHVLEYLNYHIHQTSDGLHVQNHSGFRLIYSCLGYGTMSVFTAFVIAYPIRWQSKIPVLISGLVAIQTLNIVRLVLIALYYQPKTVLIDHHLAYNYIIYSSIIIFFYVWTKKQRTSYAGTTQKKLQ